MTEELWRRGAVELAGMIAEGSVSAREVVDAHLERIEAVNPHLNAITVVLAEEARAATRTMSQPDAVSSAICWRVVFTSEVSVVHIDWTEIG